MDNPQNHSEDGADYRAMAELRYEVRRFLRFSENAAREAGLEPQQHQLLLALKGLPAGMRPTLSVLAERLQIQHHSAVELVDRLASRRMIRRYRSRTDKRQVFVRLTEGGEEVLKQLSLHHLQELKTRGPALVQVLNGLIAIANKSAPPSESTHGETDTTPRTSMTDRKKARS
jgi:DNA-binding MarR family transcriptional regulator